MDIKPAVVPDDLHLNSDDALTEAQKEDIINYFQCQICLGVLIEPIDCNSCEISFCSKCI